MSTEINIFGIPSPEQWECHVHYFVIGHAEMLIWAQTPDAKSSMQIKFFGVEYFSGLTRWKSADFRYGSSDECLRILETVPRFTKPIAPEWLVLHRLYEIHTDTYSIKIVAMGSEILHDDSPILS